MSQYRQPTDWERRVFRRLVEPPFPGRNEVETQLNNALVRNIDENGSLEIQPQVSDKAPVVKRVPVEAECKDSDGRMIHFLLHVVHGAVNELEIFKDDSSRIARIPNPEEFDVFSLPPPG